MEIDWLHTLLGAKLGGLVIAAYPVYRKIKNYVEETVNRLEGKIDELQNDLRSRRRFWQSK